jgi:SAM-dependent methyltransferase
LTLGELYDDAFSWDPSQEIGYVDDLIGLYAKKPIRRLLDIGAGTGRFTEPLIKRCSKYIAIEPDVEMRSVLERRLLELNPKVAASVLSCAFEDAVLNETCDIGVLLTDVISYVVPRARLLRFLASLRSAIIPEGLLIVDVGLWAGYVGERREESWCVERVDAVIEASCRAVLARFDRKGLYRREILTFCKKTSDRCIIARREGILAAFTPVSIIGDFEKAQLKYVGCVSNNKTLAVGESPTPGRAFMAFRPA